MVYIGGASINEYGSGEGGKPGDQNGEECYIQPWYLHRKGWTVIRAKSREMAHKIAEDMGFLCDNDKIGYSYWEHCYSLYNEVKKYNYDCSKVTIPCETNCAKAVWVCALYAGANVKDFSTADEVQKFKDSGEFDIITDPSICDSPDYLLKGDILVTNSKGHTVVCMNDGEKMSKFHWFCDTVFAGNYKVNDDANIRELPGLEFETVTTISKDKKVFSDGMYCVRNDGRIWHHIFAEGNEGFVSGKMVEIEEERN